MNTLSEAFARALSYHQAGRVQDAEPIYRQILAVDANHADSWHLLGEIAIRRKQYDVAIEHITRAIELNRWFAPFYSNLGVAYERGGKLDEAITCYQYAIQVDPSFAAAHHNLGVVLAAKGSADEAMACYRTALGLDPSYAEAHNSVGVILLDRKKHAEAIASLQEAIRLQPSLAAAHCNLGNAFLGLGRMADALASYREATRLQPEDPGSYYNLAIALKQQGTPAEAEANFRETLRLKPDFAGAHNNLAVVLLEQGRLEESQATYHEALRNDPKDYGAYSNYLLCLNYVPGMAPERLFDEHRRWNSIYPMPESPRPSPRPQASDKAPLRVGYVSPDLRWHVVAHFVEPILANHDPNAVQSFCYAEVSEPDDMTERLKSHCRGWRWTCGLSDEQIADMVREDGIDILVDLAGHTAGNRLGVFARKPAPVQVSYLGYPATTGVPAIDYRLTDAVADPPGETSRYTEELVRLPGCFCCYLTPEAIEVVPPPCLKAGRVTFASLHTLPKVNEKVLDLWCTLLHAVPSARLLFCRHTLNGPTRERYAREFVARGISLERVEFRCVAPGRTAHLQVYKDLDISLDVFPFGGHTTSCDSIWMGVPVVTLRGTAFAGRMVASVLTRVGLEDLIADSPERYVELARGLAENPSRLAELRGHLRDTLKGSSLCDGRTFTRGVEDAYRSMWRQADQ